MDRSHPNDRVASVALSYLRPWRAGAAITWGLAVGRSGRNAGDVSLSTVQRVPSQRGGAGRHEAAVSPWGVAIPAAAPTNPPHFTTSG